MAPVATEPETTVAAAPEGSAKVQSPYVCPKDECPKSLAGGFEGYNSRRDLQSHFNSHHRGEGLTVSIMDFGGGLGEDAPGWEKPYKKAERAKAERRETEIAERAGKAAASGVAKPPASERIPGSLGDEVPEDVTALESPRHQMEAIARQLGVPRNQAASMASYLSQSYEVTDPEAVWEGLKEVTEIMPTLKRRFHRTWCSLLGVREFTPELTAKIEKDLADAGLASGMSDGASKGRKRLFTAVHGEVYPTDDEEVGVSWAQAMQMANAQNERMMAGQGDGGQSLMVTLMQMSAEDRRHAAEMQQQNQQTLITALKGDGDGKRDELTLGLVTSLNDAKLAAIKQDSENRAKFIELLVERQGQDLTKALTSLTNTVNLLLNRTAETKKSFAEELKELTTVASLLGFHRPGESDGTPTIKLAEGEMSIDTYERLESIKNRKEGWKFLREVAPEFIDVGRDIATAYARSQGVEEVGRTTEDGEAAVPSGKTVSRCIQCKQEVLHTEGANFGCPQCGQLQTSDGKPFAVNDPGAEREQSVAEQAAHEEAPAASAAPTPPDDGSAAVGAKKSPVSPSPETPRVVEVSRGAGAQA